MTDDSQEYGWIFDTDAIVKKVLKQFDIDQEHIDKAKEVIDMLEFTKEDGKDVIYINIGENIQVRINR